MRLADLTVEVRDANLNRIGTILHEDLDIAFTVPHNNVGTWLLKISTDHALATALRTPGFGIIVSHADEVLMSGPVVRPTLLTERDSPLGNLVIDGVTDSIILADRLAFPDPAQANPALQSHEYDVRTGPAESVIHSYVSANIGPAAPSGRRVTGLTMGPNLGRGPTSPKSARFDVLGELVGQVALAGSLGFGIVQRGDALVFETTQIVDRTALIRLDIANNTLSAQKLTVASPEITRAIVAARDVDKTEENTNPPVRFVEFVNTASSAAEADWGRRIERFISQVSAQEVAELQQAASEALAEKGFTAVNVAVVPMDGETMQFGTDWFLGDKVAVSVDDAEYVSVVTAYSLRADNSGFFLSATLGDPADFDAAVALRKRVQSTQRRVSALERNG